MFICDKETSTTSCQTSHFFTDGADFSVLQQSPNTFKDCFRKIPFLSSCSFFWKAHPLESWNTVMSSLLSTAQQYQKLISWFAFFWLNFLLGSAIVYILSLLRISSACQFWFLLNSVYASWFIIWLWKQTKFTPLFSVDLCCYGCVLAKLRT